MRPNSRLHVAREGQRPRQSFYVRFRNALDIALNVLGNDRALIYLDDCAFAVDQKRCGKADIAMAIEHLAKENVIDRCDVVDPRKDREMKILTPGHEEIPSSVDIHVHRDQLQVLSWPVGMLLPGTLMSSRDRATLSTEVQKTIGLP